QQRLLHLAIGVAPPSGWPSAPRPRKPSRSGGTGCSGASSPPRFFPEFSTSATSLSPAQPDQPVSQPAASKRRPRREEAYRTVAGNRDVRWSNHIGRLVAAGEPQHPWLHPRSHRRRLHDRGDSSTHRADVQKPSTETVSARILDRTSRFPM